MSDETRLSRRQLKEQGKLSVRPADGVNISETTELHLRRPSRKELREARKAETGTFAAVTEDSQATHEESTTGSAGSDSSPTTSSSPATNTPDPSESKPERTSVFARFKLSHEEQKDDAQGAPDLTQLSAQQDKADEDTGESDGAGQDLQPETQAKSAVGSAEDHEQSATMPALDTSQAHDEPKMSEETADPHKEEAEADEVSSEVVQPEVSEAGTQDEAQPQDASDDEPADDAEAADNGQMRERLLSMTRRQPTADEQTALNTGDIARTSVMPEGADLEAEELAQLTDPEKEAPQAPTSSEQTDDPDARGSMAYYEEDDLDKEISPRRTILNYILLLLIATLVGILVGLGLQSLLFSSFSDQSVTTYTTELLL